MTEKTKTKAIAVVIGAIGMSLVGMIHAPWLLSLCVGVFLTVWFFDRKAGAKDALQDGALLGMVTAVLGTILLVGWTTIRDQLGLSPLDSFEKYVLEENLATPEQLEEALADVKANPLVSRLWLASVVYNAIFGFIIGFLGGLIFKTRQASPQETSSHEDREASPSDTQPKTTPSIRGTTIDRLAHLLLLNLFLPVIALPALFLSRGRLQAAEGLYPRVIKVSIQTAIWISAVLLLDFYLIKFVFLPTIDEAMASIAYSYGILLPLYLRQLLSPILPFLLYLIPINMTLLFIKNNLQRMKTTRNRTPLYMKFIGLCAPVLATLVMMTTLSPDQGPKTVLQAVVLDGTTHKPISDATVRLVALGRIGTKSFVDSVKVRTNPSGVFRCAVHYKEGRLYISKDGYYAIHYERPLKFRAWKSTYILYPIEQPKDLPVWNVGIHARAEMPDKLSARDTSWSIQNNFELIPGYPAIITFRNGTGHQQPAIVSSKSLLLRYYGPDMNLFYGIKKVAATDYRTELPLKTGTYSFKTSDSAFGKFCIDFMSYSISVAERAIDYRLRYLINLSSGEIESHHLLPERRRQFYDPEAPCSRQKSITHLGPNEPPKPLDSMETIWRPLSEFSRWHGFYGRLTFRVTVDELGKVAKEDIQIVTSPSDEMTQLAIDTILKTEWLPGMRWGKPARCVISWSRDF